MTDDEVKEFVVRLTKPELAELGLRLRVDNRYLEANAPAARAVEILDLATRPGGAGLEGIRGALRAMYPNLSFTSSVSSQKPVSNPDERLSVLVLAAKPLETSKLELHGEVKRIREALHEHAVHDEESARLEDLSALLAKHQPTILHFSGLRGERPASILCAPCGPREQRRISGLWGETRSAIWSSSNLRNNI